MGRPLAKDVNGVRVIGSNAYGTAGEKEAGITVSFWNDSLNGGLGAADVGGIIKQRGAKTYVVAPMEDIVDGDIQTSPNKYTCTLVNGVPAATGEMSIQADDGTYIAKITKRVMTDFSGNRYTWAMINYEDSAGDAIALTPIV